MSEIPSRCSGSDRKWSLVSGADPTPLAVLLLPEGPAPPFGMVQVGPDTTGYIEQEHFTLYNTAGYYGRDDTILGFSHVHLHGAGLPDLGTVLLMPTIGPVDSTIVPDGYHCPFDPASQDVRPGYYKVSFDKGPLVVELTATERTAFHRYRYGEAHGQPAVVVDLGHTLRGGVPIDAALTIQPEKETIEGYVRSKNALSLLTDGMTVYFSARFDRPFNDWGSWSDRTLKPQTTSQSGQAIGAYVEFDAAHGREVQVQVGISFVGVGQARANRNSELPAWAFAQTRSEVAQR